MQDKPRPVVLQVRRQRGIWHNVVQFDAGDSGAEHAVRTAVDLLARADAQAHFRIVTREALPLELLRFSLHEGWAVA